MIPAAGFFRLTARDRGLVLASLATLGMVRLALWRLPLRISERLMRRWSRHDARGPRRHRPPAPERIAWAMSVAGRLLPSAKCLPRALATHILLQRSDIPSRLRLGIAIDQDRRHGHAWVECRGRVVSGAIPDLDRYRPLPAMPPGDLITILGFYLLHQRSRAPPLRSAHGACSIGAPVSMTVPSTIHRRPPRRTP
jgi:hypothetical protein